MWGALFSSIALSFSFPLTQLHKLTTLGKRIHSSTIGTATPFELGSGHLDPNAALNAGLVYDMNAEDVFMFLCSNDVNQDQLHQLFETTLSCPFPLPFAYNLNLPSIGINNLVGKTSVSRKVTYRGQSGDPMVFYVYIEHPEGIHIEVNPSVLDFSGGQKTLTFSVDVSMLRLRKLWADLLLEALLGLTKFMESGVLLPLKLFEEG